MTYALRRHVSLRRTAFVSGRAADESEEPGVNDNDRNSLPNLAQNAQTRHFHSQTRPVSSTSSPGSGEPR